MPKRICDSVVYQATIDLLREHGYAGTTTRRIAELAEINEVTLFRKYGNKSALVVAAVKQNLVSPVVDYSGDVADDLLSFAEQACEHNSQFFPLLVSQIAYYPELDDLLTSAMDSTHSFTSLVERYQREGILREEPPIHIMNALLVPIMLNKLFQDMDGGVDIPPLDIPTYVDHFLAGRVI